MLHGRPLSPRARWQSGVGGLALLAAQQSCASGAPSLPDDSNGHGQSFAGSGGSAGAVTGAAGTNVGGTNAGGANAGGANGGGMNAGGAGVMSGGSSGAGGSAVAAAFQAACADYLNIVTTDCAHLGCHAGPNATSQLDLSPDTGLPSRVKDVPAKHLNITCSPPGADIVECTSVPAAPAPANALLVDSSNWQASWIIAKLRAMSTGCGDTMPDAEYLTEKTDRELCIERLVQAIAALPK